MTKTAIPAALVLVAALARAAWAQTAPPSSPAPAWHARTVIIIDPRPYLGTPSPAPHRRPQHRPTPRPHGTRRPVPKALHTPETFERLDTSPSAR